MTKSRTYGHTKSGKPIEDADVKALSAEAEAGFDIEEMLARRGKRGRPSLGSAPASVESVRLDPQLKNRLNQRAKAEGRSTSEIIREAIRQFLKAG